MKSPGGVGASVGHRTVERVNQNANQSTVIFASLVARPGVPVAFSGRPCGCYGKDLAASLPGYADCRIAGLTTLPPYPLHYR